MDGQDIETGLFTAVLQHSSLNSVTALTVMQAQGFVSAAHPEVPLGLLHIQCLQRWFVSLHMDSRKHKQRLVTVPPQYSTGTHYLVCHSVHRCIQGPSPLGGGADLVPFQESVGGLFAT